MDRRGFTLIEIIVASVIIVLLASISVPLAEMMFAQAKVDQVHVAVTEIRTAIQEYRDDTGIYPPINAEETVADALHRALVQNGYLLSLPKNPVTNSPLDWEIRDSVNEEWFRFNQKKPQSINSDLHTNQAGTGVFTPVATAMINPRKYLFPTDIYDIRFPKAIDIKTDSGIYYYEF